MVEKEKRLLFFEKYITFGVVLWIIVDILLGRLNSDIAEFLNTWHVYQISLPIAICLFFMIYPIMVQIVFKKSYWGGKNTKTCRSDSGDKLVGETIRHVYFLPGCSWASFS